jgi:hypothetical protein
MTPKIKKDLSYIDTLEDLKAEKRRLRARIKSNEHALTQQWEKLPAETFKLAIRKVVPFYLNNKVLNKSWGLFSGALGLLRAGGRTDAKKQVLGTAKKLGIFTAIRAVYNLWRKKK